MLTQQQKCQVTEVNKAKGISIT